MRRELRISHRSCQTMLCYVDDGVLPESLQVAAAMSSVKQTALMQEVTAGTMQAHSTTP